MPGSPLKLYFTDNQYIDRCRSLFATAGLPDMDSGLDITGVGLTVNLVTVFLDLTHLPLCHGEPQERKRNGILHANIEFRTPLPNSINVIVYMEFDIFVDKKRHITIMKDY